MFKLIKFIDNLFEERDLSSRIKLDVSVGNVTDGVNCTVMLDNATSNVVGDVAKDSKISLSGEVRLLEHKFKQLEVDYPKILDPKKWTILRVDGRAFHTFTKRFHKPCDGNFKNAMVQASLAWAAEFAGCLAYTQSDEATLVIPASNEPTAQLPFGGRTLKLCTVSASFFTVRFNWYISRASAHNTYTAHFDCRVFQVDDVNSVRDVIRWRQLDAFRNGVTAIASTLGVENTINTNGILKQRGTKEKLEAIKNYMMGDEYKAHHVIHGTFIKKIKVVTEGVGNVRSIWATRLKYRSVDVGTDYIVNTPTAEWLCSSYIDDEVKENNDKDNEINEQGLP